MMKVDISGYSLLGLGEEFTDYVKQRLDLSLSGQFINRSSVKVVIIKRNHLFNLAITLSEGLGKFFLQFRGDARALDAYHAFDLALNHLNDQIAEYKIKEGLKKA